jgi:hypothetical protein
MGVHHDGSCWFALCWWYFLFRHYLSARLPIQTSKGINLHFTVFNLINSEFYHFFFLSNYNFWLTYVFAMSRWFIAHASITATLIPQVKFALTFLKTIGLLPWQFPKSCYQYAHYWLMPIHVSYIIVLHVSLYHQFILINW